ncbi:MAG TPA: hypothetical protein VMW29_02800 [Candidatus Bathyarchaeia archaeon]|nr:hypothetical protein [Candidatus Bathyarchaeia archaeon]
MNNKLTKRQAIEFLNLDEKVFDNYFRNAGEFAPLPRGGDRGRFYFDKGMLQEWLDNYKYRSIELNIEDYKMCLDFALAQHFRGYVLSDWGTARQREFGQKLTNWIKGQLAEVAVQKFFENEFGCRVELDFGIHDEIVPQDIIAVEEKNKKREPKIGVGIKSSKPKSAYLVLGENEITISERKSDVYIFCRPDIPDDHLLRITKNRIEELVKNQQHFQSYKDDIPRFENVYCEIAGWADIDELEKVKSIPGIDFNGWRYVKKTGLLHKSKKDWEKLIKRL